MAFVLQKASFLKRIPAAILDFILVVLVASGVALAASAITGYDGYNDRLGEFYDTYEEKYGIEFDITVDEYDALSDEDKGKYDDAYKELTEDGDAMHVYSMVVNLTLVIVSLSALIAVLIVEFVIPMFLKNGQTVGKKIFGVALMRTDGVKVSAPMLFIRALLGKYTIEIMIPLLIMMMIYFNSIGVVGVIVLGLILILEVVLVALTRTNSFIHDILANTVAVDMSTQMIFDSVDDMIEYKKKLHAEDVAKNKD